MILSYKTSPLLWATHTNVLHVFIKLTNSYHAIPCCDHKTAMIFLTDSSKLSEVIFEIWFFLTEKVLSEVSSIRITKSLTSSTGTKHSESITSWSILEFRVLWLFNTHKSVLLISKNLNELVFPQVSVRTVEN